MSQQTKATAIGFCAILLWSSIVGLIKEVSHSFGATAGAALIYTVASVFLLFTLKWTPLSKFPKKYLIVGGALMVSYELCLALSIGYSTNNRQAIEVGMVNYLWPTFTMVATILFTHKKANWLIAPGIILSMLGIVWVLGGEQGLDISQMQANIKTNPLSYGLAFIGALLWAAYCVVTVRIANGVNGITLFFMMVSVALWVKYLIIGDSGNMQVNLSSVIYLLLAACAMGFGYAAWNIGILGGNVTVLTGASYFIPVLSSALSSVILSTILGLSFWQGAVMVCAGSVLCWLATRERRTQS
ncbi:permease of drug/metabolite transporter [Chryseobacterium sp. StRB126]|uniref:aromatic amino acid DMT transporter YddG n=1 Tax=Chryseobacterium sp. StRB126 TaxID=878220 RepID=UPI0004E99617|nr:aromatic amino acid DMT transporter YddG [Chryseobacterium sp. StRB126]BAP31488.1 permease of drug/metabolite transporter [Chryseobacterium sp. StRB126]